MTEREEELMLWCEAIEKERWSGGGRLFWRKKGSMIESPKSVGLAHGVWTE